MEDLRDFCFGVAGTGTVGLPKNLCVSVLKNKARVPVVPVPVASFF
ncbi:MAG: hypothetical protein K6B46_05855 [Opitutales bacterium]|nr:hypothetical protein [Opitutales bacterium]